MAAATAPAVVTREAAEGSSRASKASAIVAADAYELLGCDDDDDDDDYGGGGKNNTNVDKSREIGSTDRSDRRSEAAVAGGAKTSLPHFYDDSSQQDAY